MAELTSADIYRLRTRAVTGGARPVAAIRRPAPFYYATRRDACTNCADDCLAKMKTKCELRAWHSLAVATCPRGYWPAVEMVNDV